MQVIKVDPNKCTGCHQCELWCATEINSLTKQFPKAVVEEDPQPVPRVHVEGKTLPLHCRHCEVAPCIDACPNGTMCRDPKSGLVYVNEKTCIACWMCVMVCPFGIINPSAAQGGAIKCDRCRSMEDPICVDVCPTDALKVETRVGSIWPH